MRGSAVEVNMAYCVVEGGWTWSKVNVCFLALLAEDDAGAAGAPGPGEGVASTMTVVFETAVITLR